MYFSSEPDYLEKGTARYPFVSVIMPVRNEEDFIEQSLRSVLEQEYPCSRMEIIVADGMSNDRTREIIEQLAASTEIPITVVDNEKKIAPSGLNRAITQSIGDILVRVDGHCELDPQYVANCVRYLKDDEADGVGGPIETVGRTEQARAIAAAMSSFFGVGGSAFRCVNDRQMYVDTVAFPGYKRETLEKVGLFNEELVRNQDDEYNYRIRKLGGRILLAPDIKSRYYSRATFRSLWRQYFQYGYWKVRVFQLHPLQMSLRQFVPFGFVLTLSLLAVSGLFLPVFLWLFVALIGVYLAFSAAAALRITSTGRTFSLPYLFIAFPILHISYGSGFALGMLRFWRRWKPARAK